MMKGPEGQSTWTTINASLLDCHAGKVADKGVIEEALSRFIYQTGCTIDRNVVQISGTVDAALLVRLTL